MYKILLPIALAFSISTYGNSKEIPASFSNLDNSRVVIVGPKNNLQLQINKEYSRVIDIAIDSIAYKISQKHIDVLREFVDDISFKDLAIESIEKGLGLADISLASKIKYIDLQAGDKFSLGTELNHLGADFDTLLVFKLYEGMGPLIDFYEIQIDLSVYGLHRSAGELSNKNKTLKYRLKMVSQSQVHRPPLNKSKTEVKSEVAKIRSEYKVNRHKYPSKRATLLKKRDKDLQQARKRRYWPKTRRELSLEIWSQNEGEYFKSTYLTQLGRLSNFTADTLKFIKLSAGKGKRLKSESSKITAMAYDLIKPSYLKERGIYFETNENDSYTTVFLFARPFETDRIFSITELEPPILTRSRF